MNKRKPHIRVCAVPEKPSRCIASYHAEFLDATYALEFSESLTGAVALHRFAKMIENQCNKPVAIQISDELFPFCSNAVSDIITSVGLPDVANDEKAIVWETLVNVR